MALLIQSQIFEETQKTNSLLAELLGAVHHTNQLLERLVENVGTGHEPGHPVGSGPTP